MKGLRFLSLLVAPAVGAFLVPAAPAQILIPHAADVEVNGAPVAGAPYAANRKTTHVQTLADGTTITHVTTGREARDADGRTYSERRILAPGDADESQATVNYQVNDPVTHTSMSWSSRSKVVNVFHTGGPVTVKNGVIMSGTVRMVETKPDGMEMLGSRTIGGVVAEGRRMTRIIPAGRQGNDQPITTITERWRSAELRITVLEVRNDPRTGTTTMELSDVQPGEPDAALFRAPEGYEVREQTPGQPQ
jgi:hypothetical protein